MALVLIFLESGAGMAKSRLQVDNAHRNSVASRSIHRISLFLLRLSYVLSTSIPIVWLKDLYIELRAPKGWRLFGEMIVGLAVLWAIPIGLMTYNESRVDQVRTEAERSYYQFLHDLDDPSLQVRLGAIQRFPEVMTLRVPEASPPHILDCLRILAGMQQTTVPLHHRSLQNALRLYVSNLNSTNKQWTPVEVQAAISALGRIGESGWYDAVLPSTRGDPREELVWIWNPSSHLSEFAESPSTIFEGVKMESLDLQQFDLISADLRGADLASANIEFARISHADLSAARLDGADLSHSDARFSRFDNATLQDTYLTAALLEGASFKFARLSHGHLSEVRCSRCTFVQADLSAANLEQAHLEEAIFENAVLDSLDAYGAFLSRADLEFSSLQNAHLGRATLSNATLNYANARHADFSSASLDGASFSFCDLRDANFADAQGLMGVRSWFDANIAGIRGLSPEQITQLLARGAVQINDDQSWQAYREAGRPHQSWQVYAHHSRHNYVPERRRQ